MEGDFGERCNATAPQIVDVLVGNWPWLMFLSGCKTGMAGGEQAVPSLAEALVWASAPAVLGWALPVGDAAASLLAGALYRWLAVGRRVDEAVARSRAHLFQENLPYWNLLRLYANATPLDPAVTVASTPGRTPLVVRSATGRVSRCGSQGQGLPARSLRGPPALDPNRTASAAQRTRQRRLHRGLAAVRHGRARQK